MRTFLQRPATLSELDNVNCNSCARHIEKDTVGYFEDHIAFTKRWGYHSPYDGESHSIDLCTDCYRGWVAGFKIPPQVELVNYAWDIEQM